ncbi:MAG: cytidine deaminase [Prevotella sp.]|nr:cytidine deaminase [Prevotella sp.]
MKELVLKSTICVVQKEELATEEQALVNDAIEATARSYAPYSHFHVGAAVLLDNGKTMMGCNQENVSYPAGICAERSAIYAAGAQYPDTPIKTIAIAARGTDGELQEDPISPCGICRQVIIESETRFRRPIRILLYGTKHIYIIKGIKDLMPLSFTDF